ncbi:hypothetical protein, partial [Treponema sp. R6D11]
MRDFFKRRHGTSLYLVLLIAANLLASCGDNRSHQSISSISGQWLDIKKDFDSSASGLEDRIDDFCLTLNNFFASPIGDLYQIHRPEGTQYLADINSAVDRLKTAVKNNDDQAIYLAAV